MGGYCKDCRKEENCKKDIGFIWGFCCTDFEPKDNGKKIASKIDSDMMSIMVSDWMADHREDSEHFVLQGEPYYDDEFDRWHQDVFDTEDGKTYTLVGTNDGNIYIVS